MAEFSVDIWMGRVCRFCERKFINKYGNEYQHGEVAVCWDSWNLMPWNDKCGYKRANVETSKDDDIWILKKSEILREIQNELENDMKAFMLDTKIKREEKKEFFEDIWLPKFKAWLGDSIKWEQKKDCYTLNLAKDSEPFVMDFYPKGNRLLIRKENRWVNGGLNWLVKNVLEKLFVPIYLILQF